MKTTFIVLLLSISLSQHGNTQHFAWAKQMTCTAGMTGMSIAPDVNGNVYTTGEFIDTVDFDPGPGVYTLVSNGIGWRDIFVSKLDPNGNFIWAKQLGGMNHDEGSEISIDSEGNVYTTGFFSLTADFNPSLLPGDTFNLTSKGSLLKLGITVQVCQKKCLRKYLFLFSARRKAEAESG